MDGTAGRPFLVLRDFQRTFPCSPPHDREFNMANPFFPFSLYKPLREYRYEGVFYGAGVGYGYHFILSPRWSIEAEIGVGYMGTKYEQYACIKCGELVSEGYSNRFAITKLSLALVFIIF